MTGRIIARLTITISALAGVLCLVAAAPSGRVEELLTGDGASGGYETELFDTDEPMSIDIQMDEETWEKMLSDAMSEEYYSCNVVINGKTINKVGIRPKGNTSLSSIATDPDTDRYSLKLEFDHYVDGQTCYGLDKLILNNNYADATNMKEAVIYDMFQFLGAEASLYNYAKISLNGEYIGVYLALEAVEESFLERNNGTQEGYLYKPDNMGMEADDNGRPSGGPSFRTVSGNNAGPGSGSSDSGSHKKPDIRALGFDPDNLPEDFDPKALPDKGDFDPENMPEMGDFDPENMPDMGDFKPGEMPDKGSFPGSGGGSDLNYIDDDLDSYSTIWDGAVTDSSAADHRRVVTALKNISEGNDLEEYLDVDNILKYMAVHTFAVNNDSLSGMMSHNYYLYENDGKLNLFPWDYNLALGGMAMGDATSMVNDAIDTPFNSTEFFDALLANEEYLERYHAYLRQLTEEYVDGGRFDEFYERTRSQIDSLVKEDPTAFYTYDEYDVAAGTLYKVIKLRAESIEGQLDGTIPSTDDGQRDAEDSLIDASHIDLKDMGESHMGAGPKEDKGSGDEGSAH